MPYLQLLPQITFAMIDDQAVFLDLRRDRYFALDRAAAQAFDALRSSPDCHVSDEVAGALLTTHLFAPSDESREFQPARICVPSRDLPDDGARPGPKDFIRVLLHLIRCRRAVRRQPLEIVIAKRRAHHLEHSPSAPASATRALVQRFLRARALIPIEPVCLQDSLALHDWLAVRGVRSALVLGIRLDPFAAHCWVQLGETVLNDASDRVTPYTPILVVE